ALRCNERDMIAAGRGIQPLLTSSRALYDELMEREGIDCEWERRGLLFPYRSRERLDAYAATDRLLSESFHCPARRYDGDAVAELEPALKPGLAGGWYYEDDAHLRPDRLLRSWRRLLESRGVAVREHCRLERFPPRSGRAAALIAHPAPPPTHP